MSEIKEHWGAVDPGKSAWVMLTKGKDDYSLYVGFYKGAEGRLVTAIRHMQNGFTHGIETEIDWEREKDYFPEDILTRMKELQPLLLMTI